MRHTILAIGRGRHKAIATLFDDYARRLSPPIKLVELEEKRRLPAAELKAREGEMLLAAVPKGATIIVLDERGATLTSSGLADWIAQRRGRGTVETAWLIGGADGHGEAVRARADLVLNLGTLTWPHMLVRAMLAEQIYRVESILAGHPYHREG